MPHHKERPPRLIARQRDGRIVLVTSKIQPQQSGWDRHVDTALEVSRDTRRPQ